MKNILVVLSFYASVGFGKTCVLDVVPEIMGGSRVISPYLICAGERIKMGFEVDNGGRQESAAILTIIIERIEQKENLRLISCTKNPANEKAAFTCFLQSKDQ